MIPALRQARLIRAYAGIRPLIQSEKSGQDRAISRGFTLIDHGKRDGVRNLYTMTGGKLMTYRLMAEKVADLVCRMMGIDVSCTTHLKLLPGASDRSELRDRLKTDSDQGEILCDCEMIGREEVKAILDKEKLKEPVNILHRTRLAKGTCQGGFCIYRFLGWLHDLGIAEPDSNKVLKDFLEERWKGIRPVLWGDALRQEELVEGIYKGVFNLEG
jgi:glycerol-3-phosphate dehydrogenase